MTTEFCGNCRFWEFLHKPENDFAHGECLRYAPKPQDETLQAIGDLIGSIAWATEETANVKHDNNADYSFETSHTRVWSWPRTLSCDWCGDYQKGHQPPNFWERTAAARQWEKSELPAIAAALDKRN